MLRALLNSFSDFNTTKPDLSTNYMLLSFILSVSFSIQFRSYPKAHLPGAKKQKLLRSKFNSVEAYTVDVAMNEFLAICKVWGHISQRSGKNAENSKETWCKLNQSLFIVSTPKISPLSPVSRVSPNPICSLLFRLRTTN